MVALIVVLLGACSPSTDPATPRAAPALPAAHAAVPPPEPPNPFLPPDAVPPAAGRFRAREIRIAWDGAEGAADVGRTEAEARALAARLHAEVAAGADFAALARRWSDAPGGRRGGDLGTFAAGTFDPAVEAAVAAVAPGEVAPVARTEAAYHVLLREPLDEVRVTWAMWGFAGAHGARSGRSREQALEAARTAAARLGGPVAADAASPPEGELLGRGAWPADLERVAFGLAPGEVSEPVETPWGFVVIRRW